MKPILRKGPRFTFWVDINLQWLWPEFRYGLGIGYLHFGWLSIGFGIGKGRDLMWDKFDKGVGVTR